MYGICPWCKSNEIREFSPKYNSIGLSIFIECTDCHFEWEEWFEFTGSSAYE